MKPKDYEYFLRSCADPNLALVKSLLYNYLTKKNLISICDFLINSKQTGTTESRKINHRFFIRSDQSSMACRDQNHEDS